MLRSLVSLALAGSAIAQGLVVVPNHLATNEGTVSTNHAGGALTMRRQILVGQSQLQSLVGHSLDGLRFRRDVNVEDSALAAGSVSMQVRLGVAATSPATALPSFEANLPSSIGVFDGTVALPASPDVSQRAPGWSGADVIEIVFATSWTYSGGTLAIELEWTGQGTQLWAGDAWLDAVSGRVTTLGQACGPRTATGIETSHVAPTELRLGATAEFVFAGAPSTIATLLFGLSEQTPPIPLAALGSPDCTLDLVPIAAFATASSALWTPDPLAGGVARRSIAIPTDTALLSAVFFTQWLEFDGGRALTSNTLRCEIAGALPSLELCTLTRFGNNDVLVTPGESPVFALSWR
ncbi:MAG: hypothetical protein AB7I09_20205 [Planctomycetota bacterium]